MTTLPPSPIFPNWSYQETTQGPLGSCIAPSTTAPSSIGASTPTLSTCSSTGATPSTGSGSGSGAATRVAARITGPGRRAPVLGTSDSASVVARSSSPFVSCAAAPTRGKRSPSSSASTARNPITRVNRVIRISPFIVRDRPPVCSWISTRDGPSIVGNAARTCRATGSPSSSEPDYDTTLLLVQRVHGVGLSARGGGDGSRAARKQPDAGEGGAAPLDEDEGVAPAQSGAWAAVSGERPRSHHTPVQPHRFAFSQWRHLRRAPLLARHARARRAGRRHRRRSV